MLSFLLRVQSWLLVVAFLSGVVHSQVDFFEITGRGSVEDVRAAIRAGANVNAHGGILGWTPLMVAAAFNENPKVVLVLLDAGAELEARNENDWTPLIVAAAMNASAEVVRALLDADAELEARAEFSITPLMAAAAMNASAEVVRALLDADANVEARDELGRTPLMHAAWHSSPEVLQMLLDAGTDAKAADQAGHRAIDYAREDEHLQGTDVFWQLHDASFD